MREKLVYLRDIDNRDDLVPYFLRDDGYRITLQKGGENDDPILWASYKGCDDPVLAASVVDILMFEMQRSSGAVEQSVMDDVEKNVAIEMLEHARKMLRIQAFVSLVAALVSGGNADVVNDDTAIDRADSIIKMMEERGVFK